MNGSFGVILAGGLATRMGGGDKGALPLGSSTLLTHVIDRLSPQVEGIALNANGNAARFANLGFPVIADSIDGFAGPLAGVLAGLDWAAKQGATSIVTAAADTPLFRLIWLHCYTVRVRGVAHPLVIAATPDPKRGTSRHPTFGLWPVALREDLRATLLGGVRKVVQWTDSHDGRLAMFPVDQVDPFFNVNTPEDLAQAEAML